MPNTFTLASTLVLNKSISGRVQWDRVDGAVLVYDVTAPATLQSVGDWASLAGPAGHTPPAAVLANKTDLSHRRVVTAEAGQLAAEKLGLRHFEVSAVSTLLPYITYLSLSLFKCYFLNFFLIKTSYLNAYIDYTPLFEQHPFVIESNSKSNYLVITTQ